MIPSSFWERTKACWDDTSGVSKISIGNFLGLWVEFCSLTSFQKGSEIFWEDNYEEHSINTINYRKEIPNKP